MNGKNQMSKRRRTYIFTVKFLSISAAAVTAVLVLFLVIYVLKNGVPNLSAKLVFSKPSYLDGTIGILPDILNTVYILVAALLLVLPLGVVAAIYLNEYAKNKRIVAAIEYAAEKNVTVSVSGDETEVLGTKSLIYEIIYNLCDNALKYNVPGGSVKVSVSHNETYAEIDVSDTGIGISPEDRERIFERFYRVDKSHSKSSGGTGLGLSIVKHAVLYHGGKVTVESEPQKGSCFKVFLPLK